MKTITQIRRFAGVVGFGMAWLVLLRAQGQQPPGAKLWDYDAKSRVSSSPAVGSDGTIYVGAGNHLVALYPNGGEKWRFNTQGTVHSSPAVGAQGAVFFGSLDRNLYAVSPSGTQLWAPFPTDGPVYSSPAIDEEGTIYVGSDDFRVYAVRSDGKLKWSYPTGGYVRSSPALGANGAIYVGSFDRSVHALDRAGRLLWSFPTGHYVYSSPAIGPDGTIYVGSVDKSLYALNPDGTRKWAYPTGGHIYASPALGIDGTIYIGSWDNRLYAINPAGTLQWFFSTGSLVQSSAVVGADGTIYFGSDENKIYAVTPGGNKLWSLATGSLVRSSPLLTHRLTLYCGSEDNHLYALRVAKGPVNTSWPMFRANPSRRGGVLLVITNQPQRQSVTVAHSVAFTVAASGAGPLRYQWRLDGTNLAGAGDSTLTLTNAQSGHAGNYSVVVSNTLETVISDSAQLTVVVPPTVTTQPESQTNIVGATTVLRVTVASASAPSYGWMFQGRPLPGETNPMLTLANLAQTNAGEYAVIVSNSAGAVTSAVANLSVVALPEITRQPRHEVGAIGSTLVFSVEAQSTATLTYQWRLNGTNIPGATAPSWEVKNVQPILGGSYSVIVSNKAGVTPSAAALLTVTLPPLITTQPTSQTGVAGRPITLGVVANSAGPLTYEWYFKDTAVTGAPGNTLSFAKAQPSNAGPYFVVVSNVAGTVTSATANLTILVPPTIAIPPLSQTGVFGKSVTFRVAANGTPPLDYAWQWYHSNLPGAVSPTSLSLTLNALIPAQSGPYTVVVTNIAGSITSAPAILLVPRPPTVWEKLKSFF